MYVNVRVCTTAWPHKRVFELFHELPGVAGIEQVDVSGSSVEHFEGQPALAPAAGLVDGGVNGRRLLVRIAAVLQRERQLVRPGGRGQVVCTAHSCYGDCRPNLLTVVEGDCCCCSKYSAIFAS